jgi:integrase
MSTKVQKSGKEVAKQTRSKTDVRYWEVAVYKPKFPPSGSDQETVPGQRKSSRETKHYSVRILHQGERKTIPLGLANKTEAARRARDIYLSLVASGWQETLEKFHPQHINRLTSAQENATVTTVTVGKYIELATTLAGVAPRTLSGYVTSLRMITASVAGIKSVPSRFDYKTGGRDAWVNKVDAVSLDILTPATIELWKQRVLKTRKGNPVEERKARNSINSFVRQARSLFAPKIVKLVAESCQLPESLPFKEVGLYPRSSMRYVSRIDIRKIVSAAYQELGAPCGKDEKPRAFESRMEQFKIFLLAAFAGLRRNEIDKLQWDQVDLEKGTIEIRETSHFKPKSEESSGLIEIEPEVAALLSEFRKNTKGRFVVRATGSKTKAKAVQSYRADRHFDGLLGWLRQQGIDDLKPLHVLRKEAGSLVNGTLGLYAASRFLRHGDVRVTAEHYLDKKSAATVGMGSLLTRQQSQGDGSIPNG